MPADRAYRTSRKGPGTGAAFIVAILAVAVVGGFGFGWLALQVAGNGGSSAASATMAGPPASPTATASPSPSPVDTASAPPSPTPTAAPTPTPAPPLPAMLAAIGDSYSQAYSVSPSYLRDHTQYSWVIGTAENDGVTSILERLRAAGTSPLVVDAATSGKKMTDAQRQAQEVVAAAARLGQGQTVYVTFELGTNDLCDDPKTSVASYTAQLQTAIGTLETGLPAGSRLLMLAVPDFRHFREITQADPTTRAAFLLSKNASRCAPFLGANSPMSLAEAGAVLDGYNAALEKACDQLNAATGPTANLRCTWNVGLLSERDFAVKDLSTVDYFHPSLTGQAKMAASAWKADVWGSGG
jgi:lysophospholipase L1-like esterase